MRYPAQETHIHSFQCGPYIRANRLRAYGYGVCVRLMPNGRARISLISASGCGAFSICLWVCVSIYANMRTLPIMPLHDRVGVCVCAHVCVCVVYPK